MTYGITLHMNVDKVTISIESDLLKKLDRLVKAKVFPSRSKAIQEAVAERIGKHDRNRLARELAKIDRKAEQELAELGAAEDIAGWDRY